MTTLHRLERFRLRQAAEEVGRKRHDLKGHRKIETSSSVPGDGVLGEPLSAGKQEGCTPFAPRVRKGLIEEKIYERRRDLFGDLSLVFFDTTSIYFEGDGGRTLEHTGTQRTIVLTLSRWWWA